MLVLFYLGIIVTVKLQSAVIPTPRIRVGVNNTCREQVLHRQCMLEWNEFTLRLKWCNLVFRVSVLSYTHRKTGTWQKHFGRETYISLWHYLHKANHFLKNSVTLNNNTKVQNPGGARKEWQTGLQGFSFPGPRSVCLGNITPARSHCLNFCWI